MNSLRLWVVMSEVMLTDFYVLNPSIRMMTLSMFLLTSLHILKSGFPRLSLFKGSRLGILLGWSFLFVFYMAVVDLIHNTALYEVFVRAFSHILIIMQLPAFIDRSNTFRLTQWFKRLALISVGFATIQVAGLHLTLADIVPNLGLIGSEPVREDLIDSYGRATGASYNTIAFAMHMAALVLLAFASNQLQPGISAKSFGIFGILGLLFSQTRAALFGLLPAIAVSYSLFSNSRTRALKKVIPLLFIMLIAAWGGTKIAEHYFPYLVKKIDEGDTHRFTTNWYMSMGVLAESPLIGISADDAWDVYYRHADPSTAVHYSGEMKTPTHHNQPGYYLRYYGVIGLLFLLIIHIQIFRLVATSPVEPIRIFLGSFFILHFIYSLAHNNKLLTSPILWIFLSMALISTDNTKSAISLGRH